MTIKVLVTAVGQHVLADVKQVEDTETNQVLAYWLKDARIVTYHPQESGQVAINLGEFCPVANGGEFSVLKEHVVAILDPREDVLKTYEELINPAPAVAEVTVEEEA